MATDTKEDVIKKLTDAGIAHDPSDTKANLQALLPSEAVEAPAADTSGEFGDIEVSDPMILRPVDLPLVVKPANGGEWANEAQAEYAKMLNAYAYKNPEKWNNNRRDLAGNEIPNSAKKFVLIKNLQELATNPGKLAILKGSENPALTYKNKLIQTS